VAAALSGLGFVAEDRGELDVASGYYRESLTACRENGDRYTSARALMLLGEVERKRGDHAAARAFYEEALDLARAVGSVYVTGLLEGNLAYLAAACGRPRKAVTHARAALAACRETGSWTVGLPVLVAMAEVAAGEGEPERALELLGHVLGHPGNRQDHRMEVERVLARIRRDYPAVDVERGLAAGQAALFDDLVSEALDESRPAPRAGGRRR
jgi:tetratricopeptide (TPR) repeat protein